MPGALLLPYFVKKIESNDYVSGFVNQTTQISSELPFFCCFTSALHPWMMEIVLTGLCVTIWRRTYAEEWDSVKGICLLLQAIDAVDHLCEPFFFSRKLLNNWNRGEIRDCSISILRVMWSFWKQHRRRCGYIRGDSIFVCNNTCWWQVYSV